MSGLARSGALHILSAVQVQSAPDGVHADGGGLSLRVARASASWVLRFTSPCGRRREMGLGPAPRSSLDLAGRSLADAREAANSARSQVRQGIDPIDSRARSREDARTARAEQRSQRDRDQWTLARCARDFHEREIEPSCTPAHSAQWIRSLENHVPASLWHAPVNRVTAPMLLGALLAAKAHERARNHGNLGETLRRVRQRLDCVFDDAVFHGRCGSSPAAAIARKLSKSRPVRAHALAALDYRQAPALMTRLRALPGAATRCLEFAMLTAARTSQALRAEWSEVDMDSGAHRVPGERMKRGVPHTVFLAPRAIEILEAQRGQDARYVFPSPIPTRQGAPLSNMALLAVLERLGVRRQTTVHGLCRATFSTWAHETAAARPEVIEACLAHQDGNRVRAAYNRSQFATERRQLLAAWADYLSEPSPASGT